MKRRTGIRAAAMALAVLLAAMAGCAIAENKETNLHAPGGIPPLSAVTHERRNSR